jgi:FMNH2-dependent dimethyl sulfone monooxygenase
MKFGIYTPAAVATVGSPEIAKSVAEARQPLPEGGRDAQFDLDLPLLLAADAAGFDLALFAERHLGTDLGAWVVSGAVASRFERMRALVAVHPGLWDPALVAKLAVSLDRICKGRMAINIVNGWFEQEFQMFGGTVLQGEERYRRSKEFIDILRGLWREDIFSYTGRYYKIDKAELMLKPATKIPPEIYSVSSTDIGRDFIAESCDWWFVGAPKNPEATPDEVLVAIEASIADMERRTKALGKTVHYALNPFLALGNSAEEALEATVRSIFAGDSDPASRTIERTRQIERRMLPATKAGCIGRAQDVRRQVRRFEDMGIELMLLKLVPTVENVQRIGADVIASS